MTGPARATVSYERQTLSHPNPAARYAHAKRLQAGLALTEHAARRGACVLDFGAGSGAFLTALGHVRPDLTRIAVEPFMRLAASDVRHETTLDPIGESSVDVLTCFEVLEHLDDALLPGVLAGFGRVVRPGGTVIVSVPIMQGAALPLKELSRALLFRRPSDHTVGELVASTFGFVASRAADRLRSQRFFPP